MYISKNRRSSHSTLTDTLSVETYNTLILFNLKQQSIFYYKINRCYWNNRKWSLLKYVESLKSQEYLPNFKIIGKYKGQETF